ncbi:jordan transposition protein [Volvox carteri f. nagariensis]|uniref:Jordan transposition protein n=1 Tax=Volvox carteri f. nagariensis TaxID=3068 RepID=D8U902_VOLCA|nr:jordan transposition protein [Volvox carteri f. nagariensis]EFJ43897.1 jordan transposition protein [Volvox carteri f. nagariensis]|eukprot:XP_002955143.1 jordan transposition protein [Volvox carteri f. nagariensis]
MVIQFYQFGWAKNELRTFLTPLRVCRDKYNYPGAWTWLDGDDPIRLPASVLNPISDATGQSITRTANEPLPAVRTKVELVAMTPVPTHGGEVESAPALHHLALLDLDHFNTDLGLHYDSMHTLANSSRDLFKLAMGGARVTDAVRQHELNVNRRTWEGTPWLTPSIDRMASAVGSVAAVIPSRDGGGSRLRSLFKPGKSVKMHTWCFLASPYGAYIFGHATGIGSPQLEVMLQLLCSVSFLMDKAVPREDCLPILHGVARAVTLMEIHLPSCKLDMKLHQLLHLTDWIHKESVILAAERLPEGLCTFEPPQDTVSAGKLTHQQKAYWTVTNSTGPSVDTISGNAAIGFKQARCETLPEGFLLEMHETYLHHSTDYSDLFGVFTAWLWEQWTDDTTPGPFLSDYLSHLRLRTHSRRTLLHRDSHGSVSMRSKVLAKCCLSELWCQDVWVQPGLLLGSKPVSGIHLAGRFLEKLVAIKFNNNVELTAFDSNKPKTSQACWFITRRCNSSDKMWAGKVLGLYRYRSPLNRDKFDVVLEVEWHAPLLGNNSDAEVAVDQFMNVPLVDARAASVSNTGSRYYLAEDVAPCRVHILPHPSKRGALCVLSRSYSFMRVAGWEALQPQTPWARSR